MKRVVAVTTVVALSFVPLLPLAAQSGDMNAGPGQSQTIKGGREAMRMVAARGTLEKPLDASKVSPGTRFEIKLSKKVQLDNGPELPEGTQIVGQVATDDMNETGTSKLALRFTTAVLKDGQRIPIKATIVSIFPPQTNSEGVPTQVPDSWTDGTLQVDQIGVMSGVDLHSKIASRNSGVFVSSKDKVNLMVGDEFQLAIAAAHHHMHPPATTMPSNQ